MVALLERVGGATVTEEPATYDVPAGMDAEAFYSPGKVRSILEQWPDYLEYARPTQDGIRYDRVSQATTGLSLGDKMNALRIVVDIERAWVMMGRNRPGVRWSLEWQLVEWMMQKPIDIPAKDYKVHVANGLRVCLKVANEAWYKASEEIARNLGWRG